MKHILKYFSVVVIPLVVYGMENRELTLSRTQCTADRSPVVHLHKDEVAIHIHQTAQNDNNSETVSVLKLKYNSQVKIALISGAVAITTTTVASIGTLIAALYYRCE